MIYILFIVRIINALGAFVGPFLTIFLSDKIGFSKEMIGLFIMINSLATVPGSIIGGKICDVFGRKKVLIIFQTLAALCYIPCAFLDKSVLIPYFLILSSLVVCFHLLNKPLELAIESISVLCLFTLLGR